MRWRRSLCRTVSAACSCCIRCARAWYWRLRARRAERTALTSELIRVGRSSKVTFPNSSKACSTVGESAPGRVRKRMGKSDQGGWR